MSRRSHDMIGRSKRALGLTVAALLMCTSAYGQQKEPDAQREDELKKAGNRLIRKTVSATEEDVMERIIRVMNRVGRRLEVDFDTGMPTQSMQDEIVKQLDDAIAQAGAQRRSGGKSSRSSSGEKRRSSQRPREGGKKQIGTGGKEGKQSRPGQVTRNDANAQGGTKGGRLKESRRSWGHLPLRARDEVIQGSSEQFLERYREWIERYYRALQEVDD